MFQVWRSVAGASGRPAWGGEDAACTLHACSDVYVHPLAPAGTPLPLLPCPPLPHFPTITRPISTATLQTHTGLTALCATPSACAQRCSRARAARGGASWASPSVASVRCPTCRSRQQVRTAALSHRAPGGWHCGAVLAARRHLPFQIIASRQEAPQARRPSPDAPPLPPGLSEVMLTGGIPPNVHESCSADATYRALYRRVLEQNRRYYARWALVSRRGRP